MKPIIDSTGRAAMQTRISRLTGEATANVVSRAYAKIFAKSLTERLMFDTYGAGTTEDAFARASATAEQVMAKIMPLVFMAPTFVPPRSSAEHAPVSLARKVTTPRDRRRRPPPR